MSTPCKSCACAHLGTKREQQERRQWAAVPYLAGAVPMLRDGLSNVIPGPAGLNNVIHGRSVRRNVIPARPRRDNVIPGHVGQ